MSFRIPRRVTNRDAAVGLDDRQLCDDPGLDQVQRVGHWRVWTDRDQVGEAGHDVRHASERPVITREPADVLEGDDPRESAVLVANQV
jgi:hypothetical protein